MDFLHSWLNLTAHHELQSFVQQLWPNIAASLICGIPAVIHIKHHINKKHSVQMEHLAIIKHRLKRKHDNEKTIT